MKGRIALLLVAASTAFGAAAVAPAAESFALTPVASAKPCSSGWTHAVIGGEHKCLRAGQFCARRYDSQYHRYGYHCHRYDSSVARYRLTR
jgi:hypothetical protein